jgi:hypothetical protein
MFFGRLGDDWGLARFSIDVQLKSTSQDLQQAGGRFSYQLPRGQYDKLRATDGNSPMLLVLFVLPEAPEEWLSLDEQALISRKCAYWTSLYGAQPVTTDKPTVYVPTRNVLSVDRLRELLGKISRREEVAYVI